MPGVGRKAVGGLVYHVLTAATARSRLFPKPEDYDAFFRILSQVKEAGRFMPPLVTIEFTRSVQSTSRGC
jgi:hypothetical protein